MEEENKITPEKQLMIFKYAFENRYNLDPTYKEKVIEETIASLLGPESSVSSKKRNKLKRTMIDNFDGKTIRRSDSDELRKWVLTKNLPKSKEKS